MLDNSRQLTNKHTLLSTALYVPRDVIDQLPIETTTHTNTPLLLQRICIFVLLQAMQSQKVYLSFSRPTTCYNQHGILQYNTGLQTRKCTLWRCKSTPTPKAKLLWMTSHYGPTVVRSVTEIPFHVFI